MAAYRGFASRPRQGVTRAAAASAWVIGHGVRVALEQKLILEPKSVPHAAVPRETNHAGP